MELVQSLEPRRMFSAGGLDAYFGDNGSGATGLDPGTGPDVLNKLLPMPDGRVVAIGTHEDLASQQNFIAAARLNPDASLDSHFAGTGMEITDLTARVTGASVMPDGRILIADGPEGLIRLNPDGSRDKSFGTKGILHRINVQDVAALSNGQFLTAEYQTLSPEGTVVRVALRDSDGTIVKSTGGYIFDPELTRVAFSRVSNGELALFSNDLDTGLPDQFYLINDDGTLVTSFNLGPTRAGRGTIAGMDVSSNDVIVLSTDGQLEAFTLDGQPDADIGNNGLTDPPLTGFTASDLLRQSDGKYVAVGSKATTGGNSEFVLIRFNSDGSLDDSFDGDGIAEHVLDDGNDQATSLALGPDGSIYVGGTTRDVAAGSPDDSTARFLVARVWRDDAPAALFQSVTLRKSKTAGMIFRVTYRDDHAVKLASLDNSDLQIVSPDGSTRKAYFVQADKSNDAGQITVVYRVGAPGGKWDQGDNGSYTVRLRTRQVSDIDANYSASRTLGAFRVEIPVPPSAITTNNGFGMMMLNSAANPMLGILA